MENLINQDFEFDIPINETTNARGYVNEIVIRPKNNDFAPNTIVMGIKMECYPTAMPDFIKPINVEPLQVSPENYKTIMNEVFIQLGSFIEIELGNMLNLLIQSKINPPNEK